MRYWLVLFLLAALPARAQETLPSVVVQADSSLSLALSDIIREYTRTHKAAVALGFGNPQPDAAHIASGSPADVLITANATTLETLRQQGLVDVYSELPVARDRLVLVTPQDSRFSAELSKELPVGRMLMEMGENRMFLVGNPETLPEGAPARDTLRGMGASADLEPYMLFQRNRADMHRMIRESGAYGVLLSSDANQQRMRIGGVFTGDKQPALLYKAVVLASENMNDARPFVEFLKSATARKMFEAHGLGAP